MLNVNKACLFTSDLWKGCSNKPTQIKVTSKRFCEIQTDFTLPTDLGTPFVEIRSCEYECMESVDSCDGIGGDSCHGIYEVHEMSYHRISADRYFFTHPINPAENKSYEVIIGGDNCLSEVCTLFFNSSLLNDCEVRKSNESDDRKRNQMLTIILIVLSLLIVLSFIIAFLKCRFSTKFKRLLKLDENKKPDNLVSNEASRKLFIVHIAENEAYKEAVLKFATLLEAQYGFQITLDLYNKQILYEDPVSWMEQCLRDADKILILWSPKLRNLWDSAECDPGSFDVVSPILKIIKQNLFLQQNNLQILFAYFECWEKEVCPFDAFRGKVSCFKIMTDLNSLLHELHDLKHNKQNSSFKVNVTDHCYVEALTNAIRNSKVSKTLEQND